MRYLKFTCDRQTQLVPPSQGSLSLFYILIRVFQKYVNNLKTEKEINNNRFCLGIHFIFSFTITNITEKNKITSEYFSNITFTSNLTKLGRYN